MAKTTWVGEQEAEQLLGLKAATIKLYISRGKLPVRRAKATYKAKSAFHLGDIETYLNLNTIPVRIVKPG